MARVVLRGFAARKLRALLTGAAIALGVALMSGTYILTDTINSSFAGIFSTANRGHDVVVTPHQALGRNRQQVLNPPITNATLARVRSVPGVAQVSGSIFSTGALLTDANKRLNTSGPSFITAVVAPRFESFAPIRGRFPASSGEVALDQATADRYGLRIGQGLKVAGAGGAKRYTIVGIVKFAGSQNFGGAGAAVLALPEAQRVVGEPGSYDQLDVAAASGVSAGVLRARIRAALPASLDVRTGAEQAAQQTSDIKDNLSFLRTFLLIFAYVSLFVGAFIIFNTFSITVAQRTREFGLLRTLGATRRQVMSSVIGEGLLLGVAGSTIGLLAGLVIAPGLDALFKAVGADLPDSGTVLELRTVIVSLAVGTVITVLSGLLPALRATRVPPVAALREGVELPRGPRGRRSRRIRVAVAVIVVARVIITVTSGASAASIAITIAIAAVLLVVVLRTGSFFWLPRLVPALARLVGRLVAWRGITGRLARENTIRQPGRTAVTAAALMIGLALVTFASILAAGTKASINQAVNRSFAGNLIVQNAQTNNDVGIPATVAPALRTVPGVRTVTPIAFSLGKVNRISTDASVTAIDPSSFTSAYRIDWKQGSNATLGTLGTTGAVLTKTFADSHHLKVGQTLSVLTPSDRRIALVVRGIASDDARLLGNLTITLPLARAAFAQREDALDFVSFAPSATNAQVKPAVDRLLASHFPQTVSKTAAQFKKDQAGQVNTLLYLIYALLALSVIVSLFGIVNTLVLSVFERTRELGMLRAIGTSRRQVRQMIRYESVITALIGGVMGLALGILLGLITAVSLSGKGFVLSIPVPTLVLLLLAAGAAGVGAAVWPARRASRVNVLDALATQ
jgi:putative ABC transport system permease protein